MSTNRSSTESGSGGETAAFEQRFPRRLLFATAAAGIAGATAATVAAPEAAEAASATTPWVLGGNPTASASNFLGPTAAGINLVFKTKYNSASAVTEKMRLSAIGRLGLGVTDPKARLDAIGSTIAVQGTSTAADSVGRGVSGSAPNGYGVVGVSTNYVGGYGKGGYCGLQAESANYGVIASGSSYGAYLSGGYGAYAVGSTAGLYAIGPTGVYGSGSTTGVYGTGSTAGVSGRIASGSGNAVYGDGGQYGVHGVNGSTAGVRGDSGYVGAWGEAPTYGIYGLATGTTGQNYGVFAQSNSPAGFALWAQGNARIAGTLSKSAGSFQIDHPLDPDNKWLSHSFVESPDMMNVYNGNVTTDAKGKATVTLPSYFEALNRDYRYQLTVIGTFAQAIVSRKVAKGSFDIATDKPNVEVSWQITGIRQDSYAKEHPIVVETNKAGADKGARFAPGAADSTHPIAPDDVTVAPPEPPADPKPDLAPQQSATGRATAP